MWRILSAGTGWTKLNSLQLGRFLEIHVRILHQNNYVLVGYKANLNMGLIVIVFSWHLDG